MVCRYRRVYNASQNDRAFTYLLFFLFYLLHIVWCAAQPETLTSLDLSRCL